MHIFSRTSRLLSTSHALAWHTTSRSRWPRKLRTLPESIRQGTESHRFEKVLSRNCTSLLRDPYAVPPEPARCCKSAGRTPAQRCRKRCPTPAPTCCPTGQRESCRPAAPPLRRTSGSGDAARRYAVLDRAARPASKLSQIGGELLRRLVIA